MMKSKIKTNIYFSTKRVHRSLTFVKGTPVLPVVSKTDVSDIIELLEELKQEEELFEDYDEQEEV
ncbi:MAG: hypothetical protein JXN63_00535 [Candidatus Delongbacteria bacterium]|nr:hypothetical protein [Candidatus Delongbacteria bacterium]